jgi:hypothetical protein
MKEPPSVDYRGIRFTADRIAILDGGTEAVAVPLESVRSLTLRRGFIAERPLFEGLFGLGCCVLGLIAVRAAVLWIFGSRYVSRSLTMLALLLPLGAWLLRDALRRGFYLLAELDRGSRKFPFAGALDAEFSGFIRQAGDVSGRTIDVSAYPHPRT